MIISSHQGQYACRPFNKILSASNIIAEVHDYEISIIWHIVSSYLFKLASAGHEYTLSRLIGEPSLSKMEILDRVDSSANIVLHQWAEMIIDGDNITVASRPRAVIWDIAYEYILYKSFFLIIMSESYRLPWLHQQICICHGICGICPRFLPKYLS